MSDVEHENAIFILIINLIIYAMILGRIWQDEDKDDKK